MKIAFLTETQYLGKWPENFSNVRTEVAWQIALNADHFPVETFEQVSDYDWVMLILPKGGVSLSAEGIRLNNNPNRFAHLYANDLVGVLKRNNKKVAFIQEGNTSYVNDFSLVDQFNYYNQLAECDIIFAHNEFDTKWYRGWFSGKYVTTIPTLMVETLIKDIQWKPENKAVIGNNFCRWGGGFQSYLIASEFDCPIYVPTSHCSQPGEDQIPNVTVIPRIDWFQWMKLLSTFKYAVNAMPTLAAGTFSLNAAYFGIPCIGNIKLDTQRRCFPELSVEPEDVYSARQLAQKLKNDMAFYKEVSNTAKDYYNTFYSVDTWKKKMFKELSE
jgi:hypothetical protein